MKDSDKRIQFIADYISAYEEKIKLLNINGLFDSAKLFELFAIEVGGLYWDLQLSNLNVDTYTYPCVDLISADNKTYIQVSTVKDIPSKIKTTLEHIRDSKQVEMHTLTNVKFMVLNNDSVDKVKDYVGKDQIGCISFIKANDLVTTRDILQKATTNLSFQISLYELLKKESESIKDNSSIFKEAVENSKSVGLGNIDCRINNEYEIDKSEFVSKIKTENHKNISIQGGAGSGKSVLCKKLVENETNLVYARAERFREETDINKIWGFNIKQTLECLNGKPIVFFIDSLEFIADIPTKLDLLYVLYECAKDYSTVKIITSCRTSDKNAFIKMEGIYSIISYEVPELTVKEQLAIANKYFIIKKMLDMNSYAELLKSPFYINLIISKVADIENISDENELREHIWQHIICLNDSNIKNVIESIVFTRAKSFLLGAASTNYDSEIIEKLISEGVLVNNGTTVRLKYDIFEDICFEQQFDNEFNKCRGNYDAFFKEIESFGRCIYRRYQIWISNKLFAKKNRDKFLFELVFSNKMPQNWKNQTKIGLVKSRFCGQFFSEYGLTLIKNGTLNDFIKTTNLFAFEILNDYSKLFSCIQLRPSGEGRQNLIHLITENKLYEKSEVLKLDLEKLCTDYSKIQNKENNTAAEACLILEFFVEKYIAETDAKNYYKIVKTLNRLLSPIYQMVEYSNVWIKGFWTKMASYYKSEDRNKERLAAEIIEDTIKFKHTKLAKYLPVELCSLAETFWTYSPKRENSDNHYGINRRERDGLSYKYGLSENADKYERSASLNEVIDNNFFFVLFRKSFWIGLYWTINFVNKAVLSFAEKYQDMPTYEIKFINEDVKRSYLGYVDMWLVTTQEYKMPMIISDLLYCLKEELRYTVKNDLVVNNDTTEFIEGVAKCIYEKSNNIALLTIIADIGIEFRKKIPGLALNLATNIEIVLHDLARISLLKKDPFNAMLEKQILMTMGVPFLPPDRYNKEDANQYDLQSYVTDCQVESEDIIIKCHKVLDYLYSIIPNDKENATANLQIQKMDLRTAQAIKVDDNTIALIPTITGEAEKVTTESKRKRQPDNAIQSLIIDCNKKISKDNFKLKDCLEAIEQLLEIRTSCIMPGIYDKFLFDLVSFALNDPLLDNNIRARFCKMWIDGVRRYFQMGSLVFEYRLILTLFKQIETDVCDEIKKQIKQLIVDLILFKGEHGIVDELARNAKRYLFTNEQLARAVFNTIVKLAEDEMNHQKFNAEYIKKNKQNEDFQFSPNAQPKLFGVDFLIEKDMKKKYQDKESEIITEYLFNNTELDLSNFEMDNYDITTVCYAINCGLPLDDVFAGIVKKFLKASIDIWKADEETRNSHDILGIRPLYEVMEFFQRELFKNERQTSIVLNILFTDVDFSKFTHETIGFYLDVFGSLLAEYFDSHSDKARRAKCVEIVRSLEDKIIAIKEENVREELYKSLTLSITSYGGAGDWSEFPSEYSYQDKQILNELFSKYGGYHLKEMISTINKLHLDKLLPEILLSVRDAFKNILRADTDKVRKEEFTEIVSEKKVTILTMITKAYLDFGVPIKQDDDLTKAFEDILEMLVEINYEEAATILDEFRVH